MANYMGNAPETKGEGRSILIYGPPFSGKTTSLADPDVKVLLFDLDHNTSPLDDADNVTIWPVDSYEDYEEGKKSVERGYFMIGKEKVPVGDMDIIAIDSFTRFEELIKQHVLHKFAPNRKRELSDKFGAQSDWQDLQDIEVKEVRDWQANTRSHGFNVFWLGHDMTLYNDPNIETKATHVQLALQGKYASTRIMSAVDAVCYFTKVSRPSKDDPKKTELIRGMYTMQHGIVQADVRLSIEKRQQLPAFVPEPKWSKVLPYLGYRKAEK